MLARQRPGIERAKEEGKYVGRQPMKIDKARFEELYHEVLDGARTNRYVMGQLGLKPNTYYKVIQEYKTKTGRWEE